MNEKIRQSIVLDPPPPCKITHWTEWRAESKNFTTARSAVIPTDDFSPRVFMERPPAFAFSARSPPSYPCFSPPNSYLPLINGPALIIDSGPPHAPELYPKRLLIYRNGTWFIRGPFSSFTAFFRVYIYIYIYLQNIFLPNCERAMKMFSVERV